MVLAANVIIATPYGISAAAHLDRGEGIACFAVALISLTLAILLNEEEPVDQPPARIIDLSPVRRSGASIATYGDPPARGRTVERRH